MKKLNFPNAVPNHVAIIMDGNGRWAQTRRHDRVWGHVRGSFVVSDIVEASSQLGIKALTLFTFSTENWNRPAKEVHILFKLFRKFIIRERKKLFNNNIQFKVVGTIENLPFETQKLILEVEKETSSNDGMILTIAFDYGGRKEIVTAVNSFIAANPGKEITEATLASHLMFKNNHDVDLLIRTGGDHRISNFLLWQIAYAELFFTATRWPDFSVSEYKTVIENFTSRERRFGGLGEITSIDDAVRSAAHRKDKLSANHIGFQA